MLDEYPAIGSGGAEVVALIEAQEFGKAEILDTGTPCPVAARDVVAQSGFVGEYLVVIDPPGNSGHRIGQRTFPDLAFNMLLTSSTP